MTFEALYRELLRRSLEAGSSFAPPEGASQRHLDCLLSPERYAPVVHVGECGSCEYERACQNGCIFDALTVDAQGQVTVDPERCVGCAACVEACKSGNLTLSRDALPAMQAVRGEKTLAYALIAPAFLGQFSPEVTPGQLRSAFLALGFDGMVEVALFADLLTLREALEFERTIRTDEDFLLTSCCCPIWIAMIRKNYPELASHLPGSVSPMVACGRAVKRLHPDAVTVFIGPCVAKKSEARERDLAGAIDHVLTFGEVQDIFELAGIDPTALPEVERDHSSRAGRIYARAGGVSEAVRRTVEQLEPRRSIAMRTRQADGVANCKAMLEELKAGRDGVNFYEGMGCVGGCVGGPRALLPAEEGRRLVDDYGDRASYTTPLENPALPELLRRLGCETVEQLLELELFSRRL